jgi:HK97 gp10 family phage protein
MARGTSVRVEGLREIDAALGELGKATGRNVMRRAGIEALEPMAEAMRRNAPVEDGSLKDSIAVTTKRPKRARKTSEVEVYAGPGRHPQAIFQEFGTLNHAPQAFVRPAWDGGKLQLLDDVKTKLWEQISKAAARQARKAARLAAKG